MIKSMTGFGRAEVADASRKFTVEIKSVNHRYLDVNIKLPKTLNFFESAIRSLLKEYIERGKVDVFISYEDYTEENYSLKYNAGLAEQYMTYLKEMADLKHAGRTFRFVEQIALRGRHNRIPFCSKQRNVLHHDLPAHPRDLSKLRPGERLFRLPHQKDQLFSSVRTGHFFFHRFSHPSSTRKCFRLISRIGAECVSAPLDT